MFADLLSTSKPENVTSPMSFRVSFTDQSPMMTIGSMTQLHHVHIGTSAWLPVEKIDSGVVPSGLGQYYGGTAASDLPGAFRHTLDYIPVGTVQKVMEQTMFIWFSASQDNQSQIIQATINRIRKALAEGAYRVSRDLAAQGAQQFPHDQVLAHYARVLAPPRVLRKESAMKSDLRVNRDWLMRNKDLFRSQWVALRDGNLVAVANSLKDLTESLHGNKNVFVTKVY